MKLSVYNIQDIRAHKEEFSKQYASRNFLRCNRQYIQYLTEIFGNLEAKNLNYLIDHDVGICRDCSDNTDFINHDKGYKLLCTPCNRIDTNKILSNKAKGRLNKTICPKCNITETSNNAHCVQCKSLVNCVNCKRDKYSYELTDYFGNISVCTDCSLDYLLSSQFKKYCKVDCYLYKFCEVCDVKFKYMLGGIYNTKCKNHRKQCKVCDSYFSKQGVTCSNECTKLLTQETNLNRYGHTNNLNIRGSKPSHVEYWINKGLKRSEALFEVYLSQANNKQQFKTKQEVIEYFERNIHIIKKYNIEIVKTVLLGSDSLRKLLDIFIKENEIISNKENEIISNDVRILSKPQTYGTLNYVLYKGETVVFRSNKEFYFFTLLEKYDIMFSTNKHYPDSNLYYDFYLNEYDVYIEVTGFMGEDEYANKMKFKQNTFNAVLLDNYEEMYNYITDLRTNNEIH